MTYLLDTNVCIRYLNGRSAQVAKRLQITPPSEIVVCSVVKAELFYGSRRSHDPERSLQVQQRFLQPFRSLPFDDVAAVAYAEIRAELAKQGLPIGPNDLMIAAIAVVHGFILVTHNVREFSRIPALQLEDWETLV